LLKLLEFLQCIVIFLMLDLPSWRAGTFGMLGRGYGSLSQRFQFGELLVGRLGRHNG
jgi:hypothetical protein